MHRVHIFGMCSRNVHELGPKEAGFRIQRVRREPCARVACKGTGCSDMRCTMTHTWIDQLWNNNNNLRVYVLILELEEYCFRFNTGALFNFIRGGYIYSRKKPKKQALYSARRCRKKIPPLSAPVMPHGRTGELVMSWQVSSSRLRP